MTKPTPAERTQARPLLIVVILGVVFFAWIAWRVSTRDPRLSGAAQECKARYAGARSLADTARMDATYPTDFASHRNLNRGPASCGELRHELLLR
jgi:hypothetical protein